MDTGISSTHYAYYNPDMNSVQRYYPGGMRQGHKEVADSVTSRGYNGQMRDDDIAGAYKHNTALNWEYNPLNMMRWNRDPKPNVSVSPYATFMGNPILYNDVLGDSVKFANETDREYVSQFVNKKNSDGSANPMYNKKYARKYSRLEKSNKVYMFRSFEHSESSGLQGGKTGFDVNNKNQINIDFIIGKQTPLQKDENLGLSPFASLWEETYHAWDYEMGGLDFSNPTAYDEAQAWKFSVTAPQTNYTKKVYVAEDARIYEDYTGAYRIKNASTIQVAIWLKNGVAPEIDPQTKTQTYGIGIRDSKTNKIKGIYPSLPLK